MSELKDIRRWKWSDIGFLELDDNGNLCEFDDVKIIVRHQKFKRCLAMAWWCSAELGMLVSTWESKIKYYKRWHKRWLELAEQFNEAK